MITFINEDLLKFEDVEKNLKNGSIEHVISISSATNIVQKTPDKVDGEKMYNKKVIIPIADIVSKDSNYQTEKLRFVSIKRAHNDNLKIIADSKTPFDSHFIVIAFPYNGTLKPLPEKMPFRIVRGIIAHSHYYTIKYNGKKYNKCLYMVIVPNMKMLEEENPSRRDTLYFKIDAFNPIKENGEITSKSLQQTLSIHITKNDVSARTMERVVDSINIKDFEERPVWKLFSLPEKPKKPVKKFQKRKGENQNGKKQSYYKKGSNFKKGDTKRSPDLRTNRIAGKYSSAPHRKNASSSLDDMMKKAFKDNASINKRSRVNGGKKS